MEVNDQVERRVWMSDFQARWEKERRVERRALKELWRRVSRGWSWSRGGNVHDDEEEEGEGS